MCELVQYLANNHQVRKTQILSYDLDKFWQRQGEHVQELIQIILEAEQAYLPELQRFDIDK